MQIRLDEGYQFGLGVFETIAVEQGQPVFLKEHLERLVRSIRFLGIEDAVQKLAGCEGIQSSAEYRTAGKEPAGCEGIQSNAEYRTAGKEPAGCGGIQRNLKCGSMEAEFQHSGEKRQCQSLEVMLECLLRSSVETYLASGADLQHQALKLMVSGENLLLTDRPNPYTEARYQKGFAVACSPVRRNETSPLVYHKTMNYGDCILEKRRASSLGLDELIFLNTRGELCEGTTTNLFFVKNERLYTPEQKCGLLPGILRSYLLRTQEVTEGVILPSQIASFEECFVTNSLMGIMPVRTFGVHTFAKRETADRLRNEYLKSILHS